MDDWKAYFIELLSTGHETEYSIENEILNNYEVDDPLNKPISEMEIMTSINKSKNGKSPVPDGISSEFYKKISFEISPTLTSIFNLIFDKSWGDSIISPIHKSGSKDDPSNYRGISLLNTLYKIMSNIISNRLYLWAEENSKYC